MDSIIVQMENKALKHNSKPNMSCSWPPKDIHQLTPHAILFYKFRGSHWHTLSFIPSSNSLFFLLQSSSIYSSNCLYLLTEPQCVNSKKQDTVKDEKENIRSLKQSPPLPPQQNQEQWDCTKFKFDYWIGNMWPISWGSWVLNMIV